MYSKRSGAIVALAFRFLKWICPDHLYEEIEGDMLQKLANDTQLLGSHKAGMRLLGTAFRYLRLEIILRNRSSFSLTNYIMVRNNIQVALRNFNKQKAYTLLNVIGLSLGMAASLLIIQYVKYERSFDSFHSRAKDIYRVQYNGWQNGHLNFESAVAVPAVVAALKNNFPEVEAYTRFLPMGGVITYERPGKEPITFREERAQYADTSLFRVFDFKLLHGDRATCLKGTNKVVIAESIAKQYFEGEEPIGKRIAMNGNELSLEITGIIQDVPENSHIRLDFLVSYETINARTNNESETSWGWYDFYSFVLLKPNTDVKELQAKFDTWLANDRKESWEKSGRKQEFILRPLMNIHLYSKLLYETSPEDLRDGDSVYALSIIALFILVIAWVNYVNLATARSFKRANEVGVRKVVGAMRGQLIGQFITESFILNIIAAVVALLLVRILWVPFSDITGWHIPLEYIWQKDFWLLVLFLFLGGALLSGFYPAIILSSFKPVAVLKGKVIRSASGNYLRKGLVVFQFISSVFLISGSIIVYQQLSYMKTKDLGVNISETLVLKGPENVDSLYDKNYDAFKTEVLRVPGVKGMTASSNIPGKENYWTTGVRRIVGGPEGSNVVTTIAVDHDFIPQYGIRLVAGRNFERQSTGEKKRMIINQALLTELEFEDPSKALGEKVAWGRDTMEIVGVVEDFHQMSLKAEIIPLAMVSFSVSSYYSVKLETADYRAALNKLEEQWNSFFPGNPVDYFFLDQYFNRQYSRDDRFSVVFTIFTVMAIFIASLGLVGLASFMTSQRTREIGIRKALGSSVSGIILLLTKGFVQPVLLAILLACPLGWWLMDRWLQSFPYRTSIEIWVFAVAGFLVVLIAFVSVSSQTLKAAVTKPSETLKYE